MSAGALWSHLPEAICKNRSRHKNVIPKYTSTELLVLKILFTKENVEHSRNERVKETLSINKFL